MSVINVIVQRKGSPTLNTVTDALRSKSYFKISETEFGPAAAKFRFRATQLIVGSNVSGLFRKQC